MQFRFCPRCATELEMRPSAPPDPDRPTCPSCGFVHYSNPTPTVMGWIELDGRFLALRRAQEPNRGEWNLPGGFVEEGEGGAEAIGREVREETGFEVEVGEMIGAFPSTYGSGEEARSILGLAYRCEVTGGELDVSSESEEAGWFTLAEFPRTAFADERRALEILRSGRR